MHIYRLRMHYIDKIGGFLSIMHVIYMCVNTNVRRVRHHYLHCGVVGRDAVNAPYQIAVLEPIFSHLGVDDLLLLHLLLLLLLLPLLRLILCLSCKRDVH